MFGRKASETADGAASAVFRAGRKLGGDRGGKAANVVTGALLGRTHEQCGQRARPLQHAPRQRRLKPRSPALRQEPCMLRETR